MRIPAEHVGRVIGKSGQTIRQIQELSGAQIDLPRESNPGESFRVLTITGSEPEVAYCAQLLQLKITPREQGGAAGPGPSFAVSVK
jgi:far upstream element-binding protein